ncbi:MAG: hypothetical protein AB1705_13100 [Verrucomicrobiota bacterium]
MRQGLTKAAGMKDLHKLLVIRSHQGGDSLNAYCATVLTKAAGLKTKSKPVEVG